MRRLLTVLLLLVLPLQLSWAVAAVYCAHEETVASADGHPGHHEHQHAAEPDTVSDSGEALDCVDDDCAYCHLGCLKTVAVAAGTHVPAVGATFADTPTPPIASAIPTPLERPNWRAATSGALHH